MAEDSKPVQLDVDTLYNELAILRQKGMGKKKVYLVTDEEGNDYTPLWFAPMSDPDSVKEFMEGSCSGLSRCSDPGNAVLLG